MASDSHDWRDPVQILTDCFRKAMREAKLPADADPLIAAARNPKFGDFQSNAAMGLGKQLNKPPREIAALIVEHLDLSGVAEPVTKESIAGPGFINIKLDRDAIARFLVALDTPELGITPPAKVETVVVDLCGVNLAKQMHVGHLRATVIGDALARVYERLGHRVIRQNHLGDWGLPIAMVTDGIKRAVACGDVSLADITLAELDRSYREAQRRCSPDVAGLEAVKRFDLGPKALAELEEQVQGAEEALASAKATLVALQRGDEAVVTLWRRIADITITECVRLCQRLGATVAPEHTAGESTYRDELGEIVDDLMSRRVDGEPIAVESDGAIVVKLDEVGVPEPLLVRKSDGGFLYATTDLAGVRRRVQKLGGDRLIYAVDARQSLHFRQIFAAATKAGYARKADGSDAILIHAAFGTVLGEDGKPFKTRSGENIPLSALVDEAIQRAGAAVAQKNPDLPIEERQRVAHAVGVSAIKYADLASDRVKDYVFSFDRMLAFEGDTGPYLQYALVRIRSILRKASKERTKSDATSENKGAVCAPCASSFANSAFLIDEPAEKRLALLTLRYPAALASVAGSCEPHRLCVYLNELATAFSAFFQQCPVLRAADEPTRASRLRLCSLTGRVLESGLETLGLIPLEQM